MKVKETDEYIVIIREPSDSEESFKEAFKTGVVTLMVGKKTKRVNGIKVWKTKEVLERVNPI